MNPSVKAVFSYEVRDSFCDRIFYILIESQRFSESNDSSEGKDSGEESTNHSLNRYGTAHSL